MEAYEYASRLGHPLVQLPLWSGLDLYYSYGLRGFILSESVILLTATLFPYLIYRGKDMDRREMRPRVLGLIGLIMCVVGLVPWNYQVARAILLGTGSSTLAMALVSTRWKISLHASGSIGFLVFSILLIGPVVVTLTPLELLVLVSRVKLRKHTVAQVVAGALLGSVTSILSFLLLLRH